MKTITLLLFALSLPAFSIHAAHADDKKYDNHIASQIHQINQMEMQMGQLAQQKGTTADVRDFGKRIYNDHKSADDKLMSVASEMKLTISNPAPQNGMEHKQQANTGKLMKRLQTLSGTQFDKAFIKGMYKGHKEVIAMMTKERESMGMGPNALKDFMTQALLPNLHQHADIALNLENRYYA